ncbi:unnamed protein product [Hyaloperonospora brassicae]|uniref:RxLR effector candidate protein n=1 Tax=Hyaloperonospora brassicae TaxID=162125 RepID=A0AAV0UTT2_HYABA|nr:unnamed protein product [Hyaloperonospora brassicae]
MRIYYFVLVACAATLTDGTNALEPSSRTMTKAELEAAIRSAHGVHDGVAIKKPLEVHDPKTGEERLALAMNGVEAIETASHELINGWQASAPVEALASQFIPMRVHIRNSVKKFINFRRKVPRENPTRQRVATLAPKGRAFKRGDSLKATRASGRARPKATASTEAKTSPVDVHPLELFKKMIPGYEDGRIPTAAMVYEKLGIYIEKYNAARPDTPPVRMFQTLYHGFGDLAKLASFLSILKLNGIHAEDAELLEQLLYIYLMLRRTQFDEIALDLAIPTQGQSILGHYNLDFFIRYISTVMDVLPSEHQEISSLLTMMFGKEQAASVKEKAEKLSSSVSSEPFSKRLQPLELEDLKAQMLKTLKNEIAVLRKQSRQEH